MAQADAASVICGLRLAVQYSAQAEKLRARKICNVSTVWSSLSLSICQTGFLRLRAGQRSATTQRRAFNAGCLTVAWLARRSRARLDWLFRSKTTAVSARTSGSGVL